MSRVWITDSFVTLVFLQRHILFKSKESFVCIMS